MYKYESTSTSTNKFTSTLTTMFGVCCRSRRRSSRISIRSVSCASRTRVSTGARSPPTSASGASTRPRSICARVRVRAPHCRSRCIRRQLTPSRELKRSRMLTMRRGALTLRPRPTTGARRSTRVISCCCISARVRVRAVHWHWTRTQRRVFWKRRVAGARPRRCR